MKMAADNEVLGTIPYPGAYVKCRTGTPLVRECGLRGPTSALRHDF